MSQVSRAHARINPYSINPRLPGTAVRPAGTDPQRAERRRVRAQLHAYMQRLRSVWYAVVDAAEDEAAAAENGWTVERARFGTVTVRDPRFDELAARRATAAGADDGSVGRWS